MLPTIVETPIFTKRISEYLNEEQYRLLQIALALNPERGAIIPGSGGFRKMRWQAKGHGKRGGLRVIYLWQKSQGVIVLVYLYTKNELDNLTPSQIKALRNALL